MIEHDEGWVVVAECSTMPIWRSSDGSKHAIGDGPDLVLKHGSPITVGKHTVSVEGYAVERPDMAFTSYLHPSEGMCLAATLGIPLMVEGNRLYVSRAMPDAASHPHLDDVRPILARYQWTCDDEETEDDHPLPQSHC